jgi:hypothetical protein
MNARRVLLLSLVLICALLTTGCATTDVQCGMKIDYASERPIAQQGEVLLRWKVDASRCEPTSYGCTFCNDRNGMRECDVYLRSDASFSDVCGMSKRFHEMKHVFQGGHTQ